MTNNPNNRLAVAKLILKDLKLARLRIALFGVSYLAGSYLGWSYALFAAPGAYLIWNTAFYVQIAAITLFVWFLNKRLLKLASLFLVSAPPGNGILVFAEFAFSKKAFEMIFAPLISDMREEYFEALSQNRKWKARWVRLRGTWSFFAAMGLDRAFAFVSFFVKAWKSVN